MVTIAKAKDIKGDQLHISFLLYGDPGVGKTHAAAQAPGALVVLTEPNGLTTIRRANPDALVVQVSSTAELGEVIKMAIDGKLPDGVRTLVVDSLTEVQRLIRDEIVAAKPKGAEFSIRDWGTMADRMRRFLRVLRDLPYHVVATALAEAVTTDDGVRYVVPGFEGKKTGNEVAQYFNGVAFMFKRQVQGEDGKSAIVHQAMLDGPSRYTTKPCHPVTGVVEPDVASWFAMLADNTSATGATQE